MNNDKPKMKVWLADDQPRPVPEPLPKPKPTKPAYKAGVITASTRQVAFMLSLGISIPRNCKIGRAHV